TAMSDSTHPNDQTSNTAHPCEQLQALIPAYSLGIADAYERALVEASIDRCPEIAQELASYRELAAVLHYSAPTVQPPPALRDRLLAAIATPDETASPAPQSAPQSAPQPILIKRPRVLQWAAAALIVGLLLSNALLFSRLTA